MEDDSYERQLQEYGHSQRERRERSSQSPQPNYDDMYYERGSQSGQDYDVYDSHRYSSYRSVSPSSDREMDVNNEDYPQYKARTPSDERFYFKEKYYEEGRSRDRSHSSDSEQRYRLTEVVRRRSRSRSPTMKLKRTKELPISYRSHSPLTPTDDEPYFHSDNSPSEFDSAYRKYENYHKRPSSVDEDKKSSVLLNTGLRKEIEAKTEGRISRKRSYDQLSPKRADSLQRLERQHSRGSRADSLYEYSAKELLSKVQKLRSELNERTGVKDSPSSGSSNSDIDPSTLTEAELLKLHKEKTKLLQKLNMLDDAGNNSDNDSDLRHLSGKKARLEHKYLQKSDSLTKQEIKEKLKQLDETQSYRKQMKKELLRDLKKSKSAGDSKKDLFDYSEEDSYHSPRDFPPGALPKKRRKVDSDSDKQTRSYRQFDDDHEYSSDDERDRQEFIRQSSAHADLYSSKSRAMSSLDARLESDVFASHSKEESRRVSSGSDNNKEQSEHSSRSHRRKSKKENHITPLIPLGDDDMPDPETSDPRTPRPRCERPLVLPLPDFAQFIQFSPLPSPCHSPERYRDLPAEHERHHGSANGSGEQSPCFSPQSSSSKTHSPSQSPSGSGSDSKGNTNSESGSGDAVPPGFPTETEQIDPDENKADSLDSDPNPSKGKETKPKNEEDDSFSDNNSDIDLTTDNLSIEERIRQLDEKWNKAQAASITPKVIPDVDSVVGNNTTVPATLPSYTPSPIINQGANSPAVSSLYSKYKIRKRNDISGSTSEKSEQSEIVQTVLSKSSIFDQDSKRLGQSNDGEGKESSPTVNDNSPKSYSSWNKNDTKENPMVTVPGSLLDRLGQGSNGSFPTLTVNTTFPSVTNNVSINNPGITCPSGLYSYETKSEKLSPLVHSDVSDKNIDTQSFTLKNKGTGDEDYNNAWDQSKTDNCVNDKLSNSDTKLKSDDDLNELEKPKNECNSNSLIGVKSENNLQKAENEECANEVVLNDCQIKKEKQEPVDHCNEEKSKTESLDDKVIESDTSLKLESFESMDTSSIVPESDKETSSLQNDSLDSVKPVDVSELKTEIKKEQTTIAEDKNIPDENVLENTKESLKIESTSETKIKGILKKPSESDSLDQLNVKLNSETSKETSKSEEKTREDKHTQKQSSIKPDKEDSVKEPSHKKQKLSKDKEKRSESSHREEKHKKKENDKKSDSSHKSSSSTDKKEEKKDKDKSKHKSEKDKKDSDKKSSASKDEKKESKDEKKKKSEKKDKEKKEEKPVSKETKEDKNDKLSKDKKDDKSDTDKSSEKKEKKEKHEKKEKESHKHSKHGKSPDKKSKSSHKEGESKDTVKEKSKESSSKDSSTKEAAGVSKEHTAKESSSKETEKDKDKPEIKDKEKTESKEKNEKEKKNSDQKKEHKTSSHKSKKTKDEGSSAKKTDESRKTKEENSELKKGKEDENKKVKDDHSEHKKKDESSNRNNKDSPDKSKDVNRKESSEKKSTEKTKDKTSGEKCKEEKSKGKEKENKDKDPDHSKSKSKPSSSTDSVEKSKVYAEEAKVDKNETEKGDDKKTESKKEEKKSKDSEMTKNSNSSSKLSSKDSDKKSSSKPEKSSKSKSNDKSKNKTESFSKSRKDTPKKKEKESQPPMYNGLTEEDRLIFAQFAEEPYMSMYDKVKRRSTEKKMHCEREQEEQKKLLHEYKRGSKSKKNSLSDITESSEQSSDEERRKPSSVQKTKKKFAFSSDDSDSSTDTNVLQPKTTKNKTQTKKPNRILDIYSSDSEEEDTANKATIKKPVPTKKKKTDVNRDNDHKFEFDSISDSDNKTSATQQAKSKTAAKSSKKLSKTKTENKPVPKAIAKKDSKPVKPSRKDLNFKDLFSDDSDDSMLSDSDSDSDIMITPKTKKKNFLSNHKNDDNSKKKLPRGSSIYTSSEESETDDEFKPMSPPKSTVLPKKVEKRDSFFKEPSRKDRESDSFSSDHDDRLFERNKKNIKVNHKNFSDSFDSDGSSDHQTPPKYKETNKKNNKISHDNNFKFEKEFEKKKLKKAIEEEIKALPKHKKFSEIITDEHRFHSVNNFEVAKVLSDPLYEKDMLSNLTNKDNVPPILTDITKEPMFKVDIEHEKTDIPNLKESVDLFGKTKNKKHKKENKKKKKSKEKSSKDAVKDVSEEAIKKSDSKLDFSPRLESKQDNLIPDSDTENTGAVNRNVFDVIKSPKPKDSAKPNKKKENRESVHDLSFSDSHERDITHSDTEFFSESDKHSGHGIRKTKSTPKSDKSHSSDVFDFPDDDSGIKPPKQAHSSGKTSKHDHMDEKRHNDKDNASSVPVEVHGVEIEYTTDEHDYKDDSNVCPVVETTEIVIEQAIEEKSDKEKSKPKKKKGRKASGKDLDNAALTQEAVSALVKDERPVEDVQTEIVQFDTPVSNEQELVIDEGVSLHVEDETDKAVESIVNDVNDETAKAVESILFDGSSYSISEPVEPTPTLDQNYLQPEFAPGLPSVPQIGTEVETNTASNPLKGKKGRKGKRTKSGQGETLTNENSNKVGDGKPFDLLGEDSFTSVISSQPDINDDDDDGRLQIDFDPPKPEVKQKKQRKPKQTKANKLNDAAALAAENKLDNLFGTFHRGQEKDGELNRDSLSSESSELERSKHEDLLFMDREDQRHDSDMLSPDERSTSDDLTSPTDSTKVKSRRGRKPKNKDPATAPIPRTNSPRASRALSPRSPRSNFDPRSPKSDSFDAKLNGPKSLVIDESADLKGNKLSTNVFDFDENDETNSSLTAPAAPATKQRKQNRRKKDGPMQSPNRGFFSPEHKSEDKLIIGSPECNGMFSPEHKVNYPVEKKALFSQAFHPEEQKIDVKSVSDDKPPEPLFKAFFEAKSKTEPELPSLSRKNSRDSESSAPSSQIISNVDKTIDDVSKGLFESTDDEACNGPCEQSPAQRKKQIRKSKDEDIKSPGVKSPIKSPLVRSPVVNPLNSPPSTVHPAMHPQPLVLPGMGIGQAIPSSQPQIGEPQLAGHVPSMMSPPIPVSAARTSVHAASSLPEAGKGQEQIFKNIQSPQGKIVPQSPVKTTILQTPQKPSPLPTVAQSPIATTTTVAPSTTAIHVASQPSVQQSQGTGKPESGMEGVLKGAMPGFLVPGISASSAMNVVQGISSTAVVSQPATVVTTMSDLQKRQQIDKMTQEKFAHEQQQLEQKKELQRQQEHHIKLKEQELKLKEIEQRKEIERKQIEEQKKLQEELKSKEEKKKQLELLHEQLQRQQQASRLGVTIGPDGPIVQPALLSPGAIQRTRASMPALDKQGPRPPLAAHHQMPPGAPFSLPGQLPGGHGVRPGQLPAPWAQGFPQEEMMLKHKQLQQQMAAAAAQQAQASQKAQSQSMAELQAQFAKQQAQQAQAQAKQTAQPPPKNGPQPKTPQTSQANKKTPDAQVTESVFVIYFSLKTYK